MSVFGIVLGLVLSLVAARVSQAAVVNAASCTPAAVQAAVNTAVAGDTVQLPTCTTNTWNAQVLFSKSLIIKGNGQANTFIGRDSTWAASYESNEMFKVNCGGTVTGVVFQDFTLDGDQDSGILNRDEFGIHLANCVDFRIHHMTISHLAIGIQIHGDPLVQRGVIDHNTFISNRLTTPGGLGYSVSVVGNSTYPALDLGTATNVFIEDNTVTGGKTIATLNNGARAVVRFNTGGNPEDADATVNTHGVTSFPRGTRQIEVYNNTFNIGPWMGIGLSGGDGVIFNNTVSNYSQANYNITNSNCSGTYPLLDQIRDLWFWNNTSNGAALTNANLGNTCTAFIQLNRDYFFGVKSGYTSYTYPHPLTASSAPPTVTITTNCGGGVGGNCTVSTSPFTTLAGTASDDVSVSSVTWSCDVCGSGATSGTPTNWNVPSITLMPGPNVMTVTATDGDGLQATDSIIVTYNAPDDFTTGLLMHLPFENGSGTTATDITGNGHPGTLVGGATWTTGKVGSFAVTLNGTTQQVNVTGLLGTPGALTLAAWVNLSALPDVENNIVTLGDHALIRQKAALLECAYYFGTDWTSTGAAAALVGAGWHHLVCTFGPSAQAVYLDGAAVATGTSSNPLVWTGLGSNTVIGNHGFGGNAHLQGSVDSVRVYGRALRSQDVAALYVAENASPAAPVVLRLVK